MFIKRRKINRKPLIRSTGDILSSIPNDKTDEERLVPKEEMLYLLYKSRVKGFDSLSSLYSEYGE